MPAQVLVLKSLTTTLLTAHRKSHMRNRLVPKWMTLTFV